MHTPLVSVIIPNYCHEAFLKQRIESVFQQTYRHFEIILLDDCSTDGSATILKQYQTHPLVTQVVINTTNSGSPFLQWQLGFSLAKGDLIWIAESDDIAQPTFLECLVNAMNKSNAIVAFSNSQWIDEYGHSIKRRTTKTWSRDFTMNGIDFVKKYLLGYNYICNASAVLFKRTALTAVTNDYTQYKASGDRLFWIQICLQGKVCYVAEKLNFFRQHTHKVSGHAAETGINMVEDFGIYQKIKTSVPFNFWEQSLICGYHYHSIHYCQRFVGNGKQFALSAWKQTRFFNMFSYITYLFFRAIEIVR